MDKVAQAELEGADSLLLGQTIYCQRQGRGRRGWGVDSRCRRDNSHCLVITTRQSNPYPLANLMFSARPTQKYRQPSMKLIIIAICFLVFLTKYLTFIYSFHFSKTVWHNNKTKVDNVVVSTKCAGGL